MAIFDAPNARICSIIFSLGLARLGGNLKLFVEDDKGGFVVFADLRRPRPLAIRAHVPELQHLSIGRWDAGRAILMRSYRMRRRRHTHLFDGLPRIMAEPGKVPGGKIARPGLHTLFGTSSIIKNLQRNDTQMRKFIQIRRSAIESHAKYERHYFIYSNSIIYDRAHISSPS